MSSHQSNDQKAVPQGAEMEEHLMEDIVGAGNEPIAFATYQDFTDASTRYKDAIDEFGRNSPEALEKKACLDEVKSRLHPMDR